MLAFRGRKNERCGFLYRQRLISVLLTLVRMSTAIALVGHVNQLMDYACVNSLSRISQVISTILIRGKLIWCWLALRHISCATSNGSMRLIVDRCLTITRSKPTKKVLPSQTRRANSTVRQWLGKGKRSRKRGPIPTACAHEKCVYLVTWWQERPSFPKGSSSGFDSWYKTSSDSILV